MHYKEDSIRVSGYDLLMNKGFEDWEYWISILKDGGAVFQLNEPLFFYRITKNSRNNSFDSTTEDQLRKNIYFKHADVYNRIFGDPILMLREKERMALQLMTIRKNIFFKIMRKLGFFGKI